MDLRVNWMRTALTFNTSTHRSSFCEKKLMITKCGVLFTINAFIYLSSDDIQRQPCSLVIVSQQYSVIYFEKKYSFVRYGKSQAPSYCWSDVYNNSSPFHLSFKYGGDCVTAGHVPPFCNGIALAYGNQKIIIIIKYTVASFIRTGNFVGVFFSFCRRRCFPFIFFFV